MHPSTNNSISNHTTDTAETLTAMLQKERTMNVYCGRKSSKNDYVLQLCSSLLVEDLAAVVTWSDQMILIDWCYSVVDKCKFDRETVAMERLLRALTLLMNTLLNNACSHGISITIQ